MSDAKENNTTDDMKIKPNPELLNMMGMGMGISPDMTDRQLLMCIIHMQNTRISELERRNGELMNKMILMANTNHNDDFVQAMRFLTETIGNLIGNFIEEQKSGPTKE